MGLPRYSPGSIRAVRIERPPRWGIEVTLRGFVPCGTEEGPSLKKYTPACDASGVGGGAGLPPYGGGTEWIKTDLQKIPTFRRAYFSPKLAKNGHGFRRIAELIFGRFVGVPALS